MQGMQFSGSNFVSASDNHIPGNIAQLKRNFHSSVPTDSTTTLTKGQKSHLRKKRKLQARKLQANFKRYRKLQANFKQYLRYQFFQHRNAWAGGRRRYRWIPEHVPLCAFAAGRAAQLSRCRYTSVACCGGAHQSRLDSSRGPAEAA